jgi:hypothetical protein
MAANPFKVKSLKRNQDKIRKSWLQFMIGVLSRITIEIPPLQEIKHSFYLYFLVPG